MRPYDNVVPRLCTDSRTGAGSSSASQSVEMIVGAKEKRNEGSTSVRTGLEAFVSSPDNSGHLQEGHKQMESRTTP